MALNLKTQHFSGSWKTDILEIMWVFFAQAQPSVGRVFCYCSSHSSYWPPLSSLYRLSWPPAVVQPSSSSPLGRVTTRRRSVESRVKGGREGGWTQHQRHTVQNSKLSRRSRRTHTSTTMRLEVLSRVTPNLSHSGEVKRSGLFTLEGIPHTHTQKYTERQNLSPFTSSITQQIGLSLPCSVCGVWL